MPAWAWELGTGWELGPVGILLSENVENEASLQSVCVVWAGVKITKQAVQVAPTITPTVSMYLLEQKA